MTDTAFRRTNFSGYRLRDRDALIAALTAAGFPPAHERVVAEHVTYAYPDPRPAPPAATVAVVGHASADGVQALLVEVDGTSDRPDGGRFHLTYSLGPGHAPVESNALLSAVPVEPVGPYPLDVHAF